MSDIFDLKNLDDMPPELIKELEPTNEMKVLSLFEIKPDLTTEEIVVGIYRKYNAKKNRQSIITILGCLMKKKLITKENTKYRVVNVFKNGRKVHQGKEIYRVCESMAREFSSTDIKHILENSPNEKIRKITLAYISHVLCIFVKKGKITFVRQGGGPGSPKYYKHTDKQDKEQR